jgi:hypothetical protein
MRPTFLVPVFIYLLLCTVPLGVGTSLLISPRRVGNFLNDAFVIFPPVEAHETAKKWLYRVLGVGFVTVSALAVRHLHVMLLPLISALQ